MSILDTPVPLEVVPIEGDGVARYFIVQVGYVATGIDLSMDDVLEELAIEFGGRSSGSGYGFGERDIDFKFDLHLEALAFMDALLKEFPKVLIYSFWYHGPNDTYRNLTW